MSVFNTISHDSLKVFPLEERESLTRVDELLVGLSTPPAAPSAANRPRIDHCAKKIKEARKKGAAVMLIYGAHLLRNGAALILDQLMSQGWITHVATNGAGTIHDWEYSWLGRSTESVEKNVATGSFGAWDETGRNIHLALLVGGLRDAGYGEALGRFIEEDGVELPNADTLSHQITSDPRNELTPARSDLLISMLHHQLVPGRHEVIHRWKHASILASAFRHKVPMTVHPGIGYDIISNHPMFNGAAIGRAAEMDFRVFGGSVDQLDDGVVLSVGSAIMGPQVFEKSISCVNNIRLQQDKPIVSGHSIFVVDLQDGGNWDWTKGEPPKNKPGILLEIL